MPKLPKKKSAIDPAVLGNASLSPKTSTKRSKKSAAAVPTPKRSKNSKGSGSKKPSPIISENDYGRGLPNPRIFIPAPDRPAYDRQPDETDAAFEAFTAYRTIKPGKRSVRSAMAALGKKWNAGAERWSSTWHWRARVAEWDREQDRVRRKELLEGEAKKARDMVTVSDSMWQLAAKNLEIWHRRIDRLLKKSRAGEDVAPPMSAKDTKALAEAGIKLNRLMSELPTDIEEKRIELTSDERRKTIANLVRDSDVRKAMSLVARRAATAATLDAE